MPSTFDLEHALAAFDNGTLGNWLDEYLDMYNLGLKSGLRRQPRFWSRPEWLPLADLTRCCGPEPEMEYPMPDAEWNRRVQKIVDSFKTIEAFPPLISTHQHGKLSVRDGNTRHESFRRKGLTHAWTLIWYNNINEVRAASRKPERLLMVRGND